MMLLHATRPSALVSRLLTRSSLVLSACLLLACGDDGAPGTASAGGTESGTDTTGTTAPTTSPTTATTATTMADADGSTTVSEDTTTGDTTTATGSETTDGVDATGTESGTTTGSESTDGSTSAGESTSETNGESSSSSGGSDCNVDADCDDGVFCNGMEQCVGNVCMAGTPVGCNGDDGIACTVHTCSEQAQACVHQPSNALCGANETCDAQQGCVPEVCNPVACNNQVYQCGDCLDNDGDGLVDMADPNCWGPCDNNEAGWKGEIPGQQNQSPCNQMDCYFDQNSGSGNDECHWSHTCDPVLPNPSGCNYNPNYNVPGSGGQSCGTLFDTQSQQCADFCGPLTPNGCDCFGCCDVYLEGQQDPVTVYLGSENAGGNGTCNLENAANPDLCHPCTKVPGCLNECEDCEICLGKPVLPPQCDEDDQCPDGGQACGQDGQAMCDIGFFCLTGCCVPIPL